MDDKLKNQQEEDPDGDNAKDKEFEVTDLIDDSDFEEIKEDDRDKIEELSDVLESKELEPDPNENSEEEPFDANEDEYEVLDDSISSSAAMASAVATKSATRNILEWVECFAIAIIIALLLRTFVFTMVRVDGPSMNPTLSNNDRLFVTRLMYTPKDGDIIIFTPKISTVPFVKRVIATGGQTVDIDFKTGAVTVDGKILDEPYIAETTHLNGDMKFPLTVPEGNVFAMGDNRNRSHDSRFSDVGLVDNKSIIGGVKFRIWPFTQFGVVK